MNRELPCSKCDCPIIEEPYPDAPYNGDKAVQFSHHGVQAGWNSVPWAGEYWISVVEKGGHFNRPACPTKQQPVYPEQVAMKKLLEQLCLTKP